MSNEDNIKRYEYIIDGKDFNNMDGFYKMVDKTFSDGEEPCRNLDAFIDFLRGGFGKHNYNEPIKITWKNNNKSKKDLGYKETINVLKKRLAKCCLISANRRIFTKPTGLNHFLSKKKFSEKKSTNHVLNTGNLRRIRKLLNSKISC